ncbi:MAG: D-2-hydroxyacid dehydrogenase [Lachnospiraceae bacterium]|nr:D-2-hydroxyacid dehydrogenase [Lachnospiraceae bacterium]MDD3659624.1 D-2-hydroxyacid dehydrogenase [Lachnospiraceae bacterium]
MKIVLLERNSLGTDIDVSCYEKLGEVESYPVSDVNNAPDRIRDADIIIVNKVPMNELTLKDASRVKLICVTATGVDNIDFSYTSKRGIVVTNVKDYCTAAVAQHTFAMSLYLIEHLRHYDDYVKTGVYADQPRFSNFDLPFFELAGKTWGIIGMGNIGRNVAEIAKAFGCKVIFYSASGQNTSTDYERVEFDDLLAKSDVISIHSPLTDRTRNLIDLDAMKKMKRSAVLINVARGPIVNDEDLYTALTENIIAAAGLDVLGKEPISKENPLGSLMDSNKLLITPHLAWASTEARIRLVDEIFNNASAFLNGEERNVVNLA